MANLKIGSLEIGLDQPPFIVAEMSGNHQQSLEHSLKIVKAAAVSGAQAIKLQTFTPDAITLDVKHKQFLVHEENNLWSGRYLYDLYKEAHTPWDWHEQIMREAKNLGLLCFSTPGDEKAVDFLEELSVPAYKIASFENTDLPLIRRVADTGKPVLISTGMASILELAETVEAFRATGSEELALLKCTSTYPASPSDSNILTIPSMREVFACEVGLSDHTLGIGTALAAIAHGATIVEKHFTLCRSDGAIDSAFSMEPDEMKRLVEEARNAWDSLGSVLFGPTEAELPSRNYRRSLYVVEDMKAGDTLNNTNLKRIRPGYGLPTKYYEQVIGRKLTRETKKGTPLTWELIT